MTLRAAAYSAVPFFASRRASNSRLNSALLVSTSRFISCVCWVISNNALSALNKPFTHVPISLPNAVSKVMPTTKAVCHERMEARTCRNTGIVILPSARSNLLLVEARFSSSASIGRLLEIARKNCWADIVSDGSSRATCCTWKDNGLNALA